jgi:hypothetical protein
MKRFLRDHKLARGGFVAGEQMGKIILFRDRLIQVTGVDQPKAQRSVTEPQAFRVLQGHYPFDVTAAEFSFLREYASDPAVNAPDNAVRTLDRQNIFVSTHDFSSARIRQSVSVAA